MTRLLSAKRNMPTLFSRMQLVDYLNGMWYMICLPACFVDWPSALNIRVHAASTRLDRHRCTAQIIVNPIYALSINTCTFALQAILFAVLWPYCTRARFGETFGSLGF